MKAIQLSKGKVIIVDDADYDWVVKSRWFCNSTGYAVCSKRQTRLHRLITAAPDNMQVDHINGNKLDNRRENLRVCTQSENKMNRGKQSNNTSGYKGVSWCKQKGKWQAYIGYLGKGKCIGFFDDIIDAAKAYNDAATKYHGDFASINALS